MSCIVTGYADGRPVKIELCYIDTKGHQLRRDAALAFARMASDAERDGVEILVNSAFREHSKQEWLWGRYETALAEWVETGTGDRPLRPSRPGHSPHESGTAVDLDMLEDNGRERPCAAWLRANARRYGFVFPLGREPWHAEFKPEEADHGPIV